MYSNCKLLYFRRFFRLPDELRLPWPFLECFLILRIFYNSFSIFTRAGVRAGPLVACRNFRNYSYTMDGKSEKSLFGNV